MDRICRSFFTGINYWCSKNAIAMWEDFDAQAIEEDFRILKEYGVTHLRVFPLWPVFQPLKSLYGPQKVYEYGLGEAPLPDTPAGQAGVSEEACGKFQIFCDLAQKYQLKLIVALITGHMSFRLFVPPAFEGREILSDPTVIKWQRRFIRYFVGRFKDLPAIAGWDLGNEPNSLPGTEGKHPDTFYAWCAAMSDAIRTADREKPIISGVDNSTIASGTVKLTDVKDLFDIHTTHPYHIFITNTDPISTMKPICDLPYRCQLSEDIGKIPTFVQEFGAIGYANCSLKTEADFYRASLLTSLAHGFHGTMWWCAFDQGEMDYAPYRWNTIGSCYGFFTKDRAPKPVAQENKAFQALLARLPEGKLPPHRKDMCILVPRETPETAATLQSTLRATYMLAKQANMDARFSYALDPIPDAKLYIFTGLTHHKTITKQRLDELMEKVRNGAVLYLSLDAGLMRDLEEITGVTIAYRHQVNKPITLQLGSARLPIATTYFYTPESWKGEVLGRCEIGEPVFFKHSLGKGTVYLLTLPLERHLATAPGAFYDSQPLGYDKIYRTLSAEANNSRICDSDHPYVRLTEHPIDENSIFVFAINYSDRATSVSLKIADGWYIAETIYGDSSQALPPCGGILYLLKRK